MEFKSKNNFTNENNGQWRITEKSNTQENKFLFNRILSRNSSIGCSSRIFYNRSVEGVPFQWEMQPGTPKDPPKEVILPPLSPPPALISLNLPKPCFPVEDPKPSFRSRFNILWKHIKKNRITISKTLTTKRCYRITKDVNPRTSSADRFESSESYSTDGEFIASPCYSRCSSSMSAHCSNGHSRQASGLEGSSRDLMKENNGHTIRKISSVFICAKNQV